MEYGARLRCSQVLGLSCKIKANFGFQKRGDEQECVLVKAGFPFGRAGFPVGYSISDCGPAPRPRSPLIGTRVNFEGAMELRISKVLDWKGFIRKRVCVQQRAGISVSQTRPWVSPNAAFHLERKKAAPATAKSPLQLRQPSSLL